MAEKLRAIRLFLRGTHDLEKRSWGTSMYSYFLRKRSAKRFSPEKLYVSSYRMEIHRLFCIKAIVLLRTNIAVERRLRCVSLQHALILMEIMKLWPDIL
jgi:hypothetical protein